MLLASLEAVAAPAPPSGAHPRLFLSTKVRDALTQASMDTKSSASTVIAVCQGAIDKPSDWTMSGYQGDNWSFIASSCALAWQLTGDAKYATLGVKVWRALLEDVFMLGDKMACVAGADEHTATTSIRRDTGYAIRFIGPHTALAYDWMHDAPGVDEGLRKQTRDCFRNWITYYTREGYHRDEPGGNYHAGFVAAKTLISIAEAGEDGASSDTFWTETVDDIFTKQLIGNGLAMDTAGVPTGPFQGALVGGDWPEGWQYGPLSITEYALSTRALQEQGVSLDPLSTWVGDLTLRGLYGLVPDGSGTYPGGDTEAATPWDDANESVFDATILGNSSDTAAGWAAFMRSKLFADAKRDSLWQALADTRTVEPVDPTKANLPLWYLSKGTRNLYARSSWGDDAFWSVFTSAPRLVDDHQHPDATNLVFARGGDALVVDPTVYGARGTLMSNALTVGSASVTGDYAPSQTPWSKADMPFARGTASGVVAARGDFSQAYWFQDTPSDIPLARRDYVFLPEGELVTLDRAHTPAAAQKFYLRFRTPSMLTAATNSPFVARADVGASSLAIHAVALTPAAAPTLRAVAMADDCGTMAFGACRVARMPVWEYVYEVVGPDVTAIHVLDGLAKADAPADVAPVNAAPIDTTPAENVGVVGASVYRSQKQTFVLEPATLPAPATLTYGVPGTNPARHVVFDAPADASGHTTVTATAAGTRCEVTLAAGPGVTAGPAIFTLTPASDGCKVSEDATVAAGTVSPGTGGFDRPGGGGPSGGGSGASGGCGCAAAGTAAGSRTALALAVVAMMLAWRRARRR